MPSSHDYYIPEKYLKVVNTTAGSLYSDYISYQL